jgi:magnesium transporter
MTDFEEKSLFNYSIEVLRQLKDLSHQLIMLRRYFWKVREIFSFLTYQEQEIEGKQNIKYLKILYNNVDELVHLIESYKDTINSIRELYIANVSLQINDTVKTLTIFSAILLPLTFITSFYGMNGLDLNNFSSLPFGMILVSITMGIILSILILFFRKKNGSYESWKSQLMLIKIKLTAKMEVGRKQILLNGSYYKIKKWIG